MRQPINDFHVDPFRPIGTQYIPKPDANSSVMLNHKNWCFNTMVHKSHGFCGKKCLDLSTAKVSDQEDTCL